MPQAVPLACVGGKGKRAVTEDTEYTAKRINCCASLSHNCSIEKE